MNLERSLLISEGANRMCFRHPADSTKCIKIPKLGGHRAQALECQYYRRLASNDISWDQLSRYHGVVETNLGKGYVYDLILDFDETISLPISDYLCTEPVNNIDRRVIFDSLHTLKEYLLANIIIVRNLRPYNILYKRINVQEGIAVLIDNIGHHNACFHLSDATALLARKDIRKKWKKFEMNLR